MIKPYVDNLKLDKHNLVTVLQGKGSDATDNDTFTQLVPKVEALNVAIPKVYEPVIRDINFYDFDGTRLYSWTLEELQEATELPPLPIREGFTYQGWNYTLDDLKQENTKLNVCANCLPSDGSTKICISIGSMDYNSPCLGITQSPVGQHVTVDWGDGTIETPENISGLKHTYNNLGEYVISLYLDEGTRITMTGDATVYSRILYDDRTSTCNYYTGCIEKIYLGDRVTFYSHSLRGLQNLVEMSYNKNVTISGDYNMQGSKLRFFEVQTTGNGNGMYSSMPSLEHISIRKGVTALGGSNSFSSLSALKEVYLPRTMNGGITAFNSASSLQEISIYQTAFSYQSFNSAGIYRVKFNNNVIRFSSSASFCYCKNLMIVDFRNNTVVPTMDSLCFANLPSGAKIIVPDNLYDGWISAQYWSQLASYIIKASEYEE